MERCRRWQFWRNARTATHLPNGGKFCRVQPACRSGQCILYCGVLTPKISRRGAMVRENLNPPETQCSNDGQIGSNYPHHFASFHIDIRLLGNSRCPARLMQLGASHRRLDVPLASRHGADGCLVNLFRGTILFSASRAGVVLGK